MRVGWGLLVGVVHTQGMESIILEDINYEIYVFYSYIRWNYFHPLIIGNGRPDVVRLGDHHLVRP